VLWSQGKKEIILLECVAYIVEKIEDFVRKSQGKKLL
jgi:hypothetical protein